MPAFTATAPGKIILFGEHAVVYGRPAIAVPVMDVRARAIVTPEPRGVPGTVRLQAPDIRLDSTLELLPVENPLATAVRGVLSELGLNRSPACTIKVTSTIPVASGLGSGAAVSAAVVRAFSAFLGEPLSDQQVSALVYEVEKLHHGTPSGIDNTVITYQMPVYFEKATPENQRTTNLIETLRVKEPFTIVIGCTGIASPTSVAVGNVRRVWQADPDRYDALFDRIGAITRRARQPIEDGQPLSLGALMDENHALLQEVGVSTPELDKLVETARSAGAYGAKLSGAGLGGNVIAITTVECAFHIVGALRDAGVVQTITTTVKYKRD